VPDTLTQTPILDTSDPAMGGVVIDYSGGDQTVAGYNRWLLIGTAGTLKVDMADGSTVSLPLPVGMHKIRVTKIYQTGSATAAGVILY
jgi:hypothetical protein